MSDRKQSMSAKANNHFESLCKGSSENVLHEISHEIKKSTVNTVLIE